MKQKNLSAKSVKGHKEEKLIREGREGTRSKTFKTRAQLPDR
jgi:hypothetical protein